MTTSPAERTIRSILVANRGEIARRVFTTCAQRGIATVAVYSDADEHSPHSLEADAAIRLPGDAPAQTYLRADLLIEAAQRCGADAIHPGYGFLSENADFARAVIDAGLIWIGPDPEAIALMGSKVASKEQMRAAGVPVLERLDPESIRDADLPVIVKASAGGGGCGMRVVRRHAELDEALSSASREAASAFGDPTVFCERYLETGHHVEVQVMADMHGRVWALGERECSLQRRHQKVIEEAPSPLVERVGGDMRQRLLEAARSAAVAVKYRGAGTVEFLAADDGSFYFLEMNTRLQVEHPVTECVTGVDLVGLQIDVAGGRSLPEIEPQVTGWSVEARLYAEDPSDDWRPHTGTIATLDVPGVATTFAIPPDHGIRLDSGVLSGSVVGTHYDAMLAKVISRAPHREDALRELAACLRRSRIHGVVTNRDLLVASLMHPEMIAGRADSSFYTRYDPAALTSGAQLDPHLAALIAALASSAAVQMHTALPGVRSGFRAWPSTFHERTYRVGDEEVALGYRFDGDGLSLRSLPEGVGTVGLVQASPEQVVLDLDGIRRRFQVALLPGDTERFAIDSPLGSAALEAVPRFVDPATQQPAGALIAPMPGTVIAVEVAPGDAVAASRILIVLEAMKMEHAVHASTSGTVTDVMVSVGQQVEQGATLAVVNDEASSTDEGSTTS